TTDGTDSIAKQELLDAFSGLFGQVPEQVDAIRQQGTLVVGTPSSLPAMAQETVFSHVAQMGPEGYGIYTATIQGKPATAILANTSKGVLYGTYAFIRLLQCGADIAKVDITSRPKVNLRLLNHRDNL